MMHEDGWVSVRGPTIGAIKMAGGLRESDGCRMVRAAPLRVSRRINGRPG